MLNKKFEQAKPILKKLEEHQHEAYFVGGCVRDLLLNRKITDIDITTSASPEEIQEIFPKVIPVGIEHGTVIVRHHGASYEVTTFRTEGTYSDRKIQNHGAFTRSIEKDLEHRDFTINSLAMNKERKIIDLFNGKMDLNKKIIRTVGDGLERFKEDPLRIIRALRFSSQLGFQIEDHTFQAMLAYKNKLLDVSIERVTKEMELFFAGDALRNGLYYLKDAKIERVLPIFKNYPELIEKLPAKIKPLQTFSEVIACFHYIYPEISIATWVREWKCSNRTKMTAKKLVTNLRHYEQYRLDKIGIYELDREHFSLFIRLVAILMGEEINVIQLEKLKDALPIQSKTDLAINGTDVLALYPERKPGPWVNEMLHSVEKAVITEEVNNHEHAIREWLLCNQTETN